ncbi:MAG: hypothetical protein KAS32_19690 [Candidatus Peribacteraceae bacterium]|nr:hypothetical protein [Candidatus Peribacteraceae bacterium]
MIKVNLKSGETILFDISKENDLEYFEFFASKKKYLITALSIFHKGILHSAPFRNLIIDKIGAELVTNNKKVVGERIFYQSNDMELSYLVYWDEVNQVVKVTMTPVEK